MVRGVNGVSVGAGLVGGKDVAVALGAVSVGGTGVLVACALPQAASKTAAKTNIIRGRISHLL